MAILRARKGPSSGAVYPVFSSKQPTVVGRDPQCDAALGDVRASRRHARVSIVQGEWILEDLQSSNGTLLGGKKIDRARLAEGSSFQIGATLLSFHPDELPAFPELELSDSRVAEVLREDCGVFVLRARQLAMDRELRMDWLHPSRSLPDDLWPKLARAVEEASSFQDPGLLPVLHSAADPAHEGVFLVFRGVHPSLSEKLQFVLDLPLEERLGVFRQIVEVILERAACDSLRSPVGLAHVSLEVKAGGSPSVYLPALDLAAWVAEHTDQSAHLKEYAAYLPPEHQEEGRAHDSTPPRLPSISSVMYNLGAMGYHILTKQRPCGDGDVKTCLENHKRLQPAPANLLDPAIPPEVSALLCRLLDKDPSRRPADRQEVVDVICRAAYTRAESPPAAVPPPPSRPRISKAPRSAPIPARPPSIPARAPSTPARAPSMPARAPAAPEDGKWRFESLKYLPLWTIVWIGLFFLARLLSKAVFRAIDG